jgi:hypothetical protein
MNAADRFAYLPSLLDGDHRRAYCPVVTANGARSLHPSKLF